MNKRQLLAVSTILNEWTTKTPENEDRLVRIVFSSLTYNEYLEVRCFILAHEQKTTTLH